MESIEHYGIPERENRKSFRFPVKIPVDVVNKGQRLAFGRLENLSRDGAAVKVSPLLTVGRSYGFHLRGYGTWAGTVVRLFGVQCHGVRFDINEDQKRRLDEIIVKLLPKETAPIDDDIESIRAQFSDSTIRSF